MDSAHSKSKSGNFRKRPRNQTDNGKRKRQNPSSDDSKAIETVYRILCPIKKIGSVLGRGGDIINALRNETNAKIRVTDAIPGAEERVIIIYHHSSDQTENTNVDTEHLMPHCPAQSALLEVHNRIAADEYLRNGVRHVKTDSDENVIARVLVPSNQVGCLIGKGGTVIEKLRSEYRGANIRVLPADELPPCAMYKDELVQGPWDRISPTIEAVLRLQIRTCKTSEDGKMTNRLIVSSSKVGCLLGERGSIINEMRRVTRADITVCSKEDKPSYLSAKEELVQISGKSDVAREALLEILSRLRTRTFRTGDPPPNPAPVFHDYEFTSERMHGRLPSPHAIGASRNAYPVYPPHGYSPPEYIANKAPPPSNMIRSTSTSYDYPKGPGPLYPDHGYPSGPPRPPHEAQYAPWSYPAAPPPPATGYGSKNSTMTIKIPSGAASLVIGVGGSNISEISQISGARVKVNDPHPGYSECMVEITGTSEQINAAQSLIQAFVASSRPSGPCSPMQTPPMYRQY